MTWVYRRFDQHQCELPPLDRATVAAGDLWQCDDCSTYYMVRDDQRDGPYLTPAKVTELNQYGQLRSKL